MQRNGGERGAEEEKDNDLGTVGGEDEYYQTIKIYHIESSNNKVFRKTYIQKLSFITQCDPDFVFLVI